MQINIGGAHWGKFEVKKSKASMNLAFLLKRIGVAKGENLYDDDYDFDEMNDDIAKMFGVM